MKIVINENKSFAETEVIINCAETDDKILKMLAAIRAFDRKLTGTADGETRVLSSSEIIYIDTVDKKTFLYTAKDVYETPLRLYELEETLAPDDFIRISKSAIINFSHVQSLCPEMGGRLILTMSNGEKIFTSRQYAAVIKQKLGL